MTNLEVADYYGYEIQSEQLVEECAELIRAINKYRRARGTGQPTRMSEEEAFDNLIEEIADVENMLEQVKYLLFIPQERIDELKRMKTEKIEVELHERSRTGKRKTSLPELRFNGGKHEQILDVN